MIALSNPLYGWRVNRDEISMVGSDPRRPECILAEPAGTQTLIAQRNEQAATAASVAIIDAQQLVLGKTLPNGLAFDRDGDIVIANFGTDTSLTFGGADLRTVYLGRLGGTSLASFRSPRVLVRTARRSSTTSRIRSSSGSSPPTRRS